MPLVSQEDKTVIGAKDPVAQVIAQAIATFQYNNAARDRNGLDPFHSMTIPAITMFYYHSSVPGLQDRSSQVRSRLNEGMEVPEFRREVLQHYEALRRMSKECWEDFVTHRNELS
ncbi:hypothetical protein SERLA73DRAFT_190102 [Serpula lacrymans var. lacrymans S7.3]|uniref:Uncharacterized protein n=2 Tax=Serpula lacrymans var. lacrymans TaxID=341189 RepID=F8QF25_SERL3|nr:uncharacterized protein SERLADRAFT_455728 [Serpula lacrymans var. lacrymans S7.9]EGN93188.1 hypothetical protein SERLA73DRAFT_190102 [Serpula lacrymans var. lacrymans S7.3]EGO31087.1 hypothetical protein SERLADRAFT_455728 [Serpula lacrymans var. lacrymans S7.9]